KGATRPGPPSLSPARPSPIVCFRMSYVKLKVTLRDEEPQADSSVAFRPSPTHAAAARIRWSHRLPESSVVAPCSRAPAWAPDLIGSLSERRMRSGPDALIQINPPCRLIPVIRARHLTMRTNMINRRALLSTLALLPTLLPRTAVAQQATEARSRSFSFAVY